MARRLYKVFHKYRALEEVLTAGFDYWQEVAVASATDTVQEGCRQLAITMRGLWTPNVTFCRHQYLGCEVQSEALGNQGPGRYWAIENIQLGTVEAITDILTLVLTAEGTRSNGKRVRANTQISLVPGTQIMCNGLEESFYDDTETALGLVFPAVVSVGSEGNFTRAALSKPVGSTEEVVTVGNLQLSALFGSRIDRVINRDNRGSKRPPAALPA